ncbi:hypothetical protein ACDA63_04650 [Uliginosibacterium sp. sgz301328]|uniref:hypothetical protein n=1 Tax=Uliginosibacterium sp. sgz301328 TaxID=3243764 RepID=UPI00359E886E
MSFTVDEGAVSARQLVSATFTNSKLAAIKLAPPPGGTATTWLVTELAADQPYAWIYTDARALKAGTYCTSVRVEVLDSSNKSLSYVDVAAKVTVVAKGTTPTTDYKWAAYNGSVALTHVAAIAFPSSRATAPFSLIGGTTQDSQGRTIKFFDGFKADAATGLLRLDTSSSPLDRSIVRSTSFWSDAIYPKSLTYLMRVAPVAGVVYDSKTRLFEVELSLATPGASDGARIVLGIRNDTTAQSVYIGQPEESVAMPMAGTPLDMSVPHIYQVSVTLTGPRSGSFTVYADGSDTPIIPTVTSNDLRRAWLLNNYIQAGDNGDSAIVGDIDWMAWTTTGAFKPSQLKGALPGGLGVTTGY